MSTKELSKRLGQLVDAGHTHTIDDMSPAEEVCNQKKGKFYEDDMD